MSLGQRIAVAALGLSAAGLVGIAHYEGYSDRAISPVPGDVPTIGFGSTRHADGRPVKSTSIGIRDSSGRYIAALCLNADLSFFLGMQQTVAQFVRTGETPMRPETLAPLGADAIRQRIDQFAAQRGTTPRALKPDARRTLICELKTEGCLEFRRAMETVARHLGVSRATVYSDAR